MAPYEDGVFLHDIDGERGEAPVGYRVFGAARRAWALLQGFPGERTDLRRIAERCGFSHVGVPREDPENGMVFERSARRDYSNKLTADGCSRRETRRTVILAWERASGKGNA